MEREKINPEVLENFYYRSKEEVLKKIHFLTNAASHLHLVLDFDRTLTVGRNNYGENISTWEFLRKYLCSEAQQKYQHLYNIYRPREIQGNMTLSEAVCWWESILGLYRDNQIQFSDIEKEIKTNMPIRLGTKELFEICAKKKVPSIIISAGLADVIDIWCKSMGICPSIVVSTRLSFSSTNHINGWNRNSLVHVLNKKEQGHKEINKIRQTRPNTILIGDSINDADMVEGEKNVIRILVNDPRIDDLDSKRNQKVPDRFDLVTKGESLMPVTCLLNLF